MQRGAVTAPLDGRTKGLPASLTALALADIGARGWNVLREDLPLPLALLKASALDHNARWMRRFREAAGVAIAPHGKTSMSPELFARQMRDGAWGITVATVQQLRVCREAGIARVLMANQLVGRQAVTYVLDEIARDAAFEFFAIADSVALVGQLARAAAQRQAGRPLSLMVECGFAGGRTGCRTVEEAMEVARRIAEASPLLRLAGVEGYEGSVPGATQAEREAGIVRFVAFIAEVSRRCLDEGLVGRDPLLLSAGGSAYFDLVAALPRAVGDHRAEVVIRSGCYLTHDSDSYAQAAARMRERTPAIGDLGEGLRDAIEVWSYVQSRPEPELAILTMGKRDVSYDLHMPFARWRFRAGSDQRPSALPEGAAITALNDQHAYLQLPATADLAVGDLVGCHISHPCTTFDKWRFLPIVDDGYRVVDGIATWF
ncbi:MAG: amino acid deaminase [Burkholderiales bacterium]|nr:amino acid deaminase [Burkholderiales bacterium]